MAISNIKTFIFFNLINSVFPKALATRFNDSGIVKNMANTTNTQPPVKPSTTPFKPIIAIIIGILTAIFSITFLLLLYMKHCKRQRNYVNNSRNYPPSRVNSGIDRKVIGLLPIFHFSSLRGQKDGLECAVCLNKFEPEEVLRLLPKCKHAFHVECVDTWLDAHSNCPLCRNRIHPEDILLIDFNYSNQVTPRNSDQGKGKEFVNPRISGRHSYGGERRNSLEIIAENPRTEFRGRNSLDSWNFKQKLGKSGHRKNGSAENQGVRSIDSCKATRKDGQLPVKEEKHRLEHRIIIGGDTEEVRRRWSDVQAGDFLYLRSELIMGGDGAAAEENGVINGRSTSEIIGVGRYRNNNGGVKEERDREEERAVNRWLAWISQSQQKNTAVECATSSSSSSSSIVV